MGEYKRNAFLDTVKGLLIILVFAGHILPGTLRESPARYVIYSFHMPAFFFVSGYLINIQKLNEPAALVIKRYLVRIAMPWFFAVPVYYLIINFPSSYGITSFLKAYAAPYYHLWFVPGYLFCVFITWFVICFVRRRPFHVLLGVGAAFSILYICSIAAGLDNIVIRLIKHTIRPWFLLFFALGCYIKNTGGIHSVGGGRQIYRWLAPSLVLLYLILLPAGYHYQGCFLEPLVRFFLLCLILVSFHWNTYEKGIPGIQWLGTETYPIYLWHIIGKIIGVNCGAYYIVSIIWFIFLILMLKIIKKDSSVRLIIGR